MQKSHVLGSEKIIKLLYLGTILMIENGPLGAERKDKKNKMFVEGKKYLNVFLCVGNSGLNVNDEWNNLK